MIRSDIQKYKTEQTFKASTSSYPENLDLIIESLNIEKSWSKQSDTKYNAIIDSSNTVEFIYNKIDGKFDCLHKTQTYCEKITR